LKDLGVDEKIMLQFISKKYDGRVWNRFIWLRIWAGGRELLH
jgi:hypothetical protein